MAMELVLKADNISRGVERRKIQLEDPGELVNVADFVVRFSVQLSFISFSFCLFLLERFSESHSHSMGHNVIGNCHWLHLYVGHVCLTSKRAVSLFC